MHIHFSLRNFASQHDSEAPKKEQQKANPTMPKQIFIPAASATSRKCGYPYRYKASSTHQCSYRSVVARRA
eukprot:scaffold10496_cov32-Cyclotella_meneghiniana.AAC.2